jgi:hypothetical protein
MPITFLKIILGIVQCTLYNYDSLALATWRPVKELLSPLACVLRHFGRRDETIFETSDMVRFVRHLAARLKFGGFHMLRLEETFCRPLISSAFVHHLAASL